MPGTLAVRKVFRRLIPFLFVLYALSYLDRINIGFAALSMNQELGLSRTMFRAAFVGYLEWGTRLAVLNSQDGVTPPPADAAMPAWNWGPPGGPWQG